jgi:hypothetical protein
MLSIYVETDGFLKEHLQGVPVREMIVVIYRTVKVLR